MIFIDKIFKKSFFLLVLFSIFGVSAQKTNQFDANNKRTGIWRKYYPNQKIRYEGQFKNGKEIGVFKFYEESNAQYPAILKKYNEKSDTVEVSFYKSKGRLQSKGFFIDINIAVI